MSKIEQHILAADGLPSQSHGILTDAQQKLRFADTRTCDAIVDVLSHVYNGGYSSKQQRTTFEERKALRAKAYRALKALGVEK